MFSDTREFNLGFGTKAGARWSETILSEHGLHCRFDPILSARSTISRWSVGDVVIARAELAALSLAPVDESHSSWQGEWLFLKLISAGNVEILQAGSARRFGAGSMVILDPAQTFLESFADAARLTVLRIPKSVLRDRGMRQTVEGCLVANMQSPDMHATREIIQCIAHQSDTPGLSIRNRLSNQLLDMIGAVLTEATGSTERRNSDALIFRAKRFIEMHLGNSDMDPAMIAESLHVSVKHLQRVFKSHEISLMRYVWSVRLGHAERLLRASRACEMPAQEIAWRCGFSTAAHFSHAFKDRYGTSPREFRDLSVAATVVNPLPESIHATTATTTDGSKYQAP